MTASPFKTFTFGKVAQPPVDQNVTETMTSVNLSSCPKQENMDFKSIEMNLKKEILDDSFCSDNQSTESDGEDSCGEEMKAS